MKKILFAATLVALLPLLFSCEKAGNNDNVFKNPTFIHCAGQFIMLDGSPTLSSAASVKAVPQAAVPVYTYVEFTESGIYVVGSLEGSETQYKSGNYTADGNVYTLNGFGTVEVNVTATPAKLTITPTGGASQTMTATYKKAGSTNVAYRGWTIDKTRATVYGFHTPITADFVGCNFNDMAKFLNDNGHKGIYLPSGSLKSVSITGTDSIIFTYSDNTADVAEYTLNGSNLTFSWRTPSRLLEVENGKATIDYLDGKCILKIEAALKGSTTSGSVTFVLSPME